MPHKIAERMNEGGISTKLRTQGARRRVRYSFKSGLGKRNWGLEGRPGRRGEGNGGKGLLDSEEKDIGGPHALGVHLTCRPTRIAGSHVDVL